MNEADNEATCSKSSQPTSMTVDKWIELANQMFYNSNQVSCICDVLLRSGDMEKLEKFLNSLPTTEQDGKTNFTNLQQVKRAQAWLSNHKENYTQVHEILESITFDPIYHPELQDLWHKSWYSEVERARNRLGGRKWWRRKF